MKNIMKKVTIAILACIFSAVLFPINLNAETTEVSSSKTEGVEEKNFIFKDFMFTADDIPSDTYTVYKTDGSKETYYVYENGTNLLVDQLSVNYGSENHQSLTASANPDARDAFFTRDKTISGNGISLVTIRFTASVKYYASGSFRSFEGLNYTNLSIASSVTPSQLANYNSDATPHGGSYPTAQLDYTYVTNVISSIDSNVSINAAFLSAGFSRGTYYYKYVSSSGSFTLYN